jgi:hypothetical protein
MQRRGSQKQTGTVCGRSITKSIPGQTIVVDEIIFHKSYCSKNDEKAFSPNKIMVQRAFQTIVVDE